MACKFTLRGGTWNDDMKYTWIHVGNLLRSQGPHIGTLQMHNRQLVRIVGQDDVGTCKKCCAREKKKTVKKSKDKVHKQNMKALRTD